MPAVRAWEGRTGSSIEDPCGCMPWAGIVTACRWRGKYSTSNLEEAGRPFAAAWAHVMLLRLAASPAPAPSQMTGVREEIFAARSEIADLFAAARKFDARPVAASPAEKLPLPSPPPLRATTRMATLERHRGAVGVLSN